MFFLATNLRRKLMEYDDKMFVEEFERGISRTILEQMGGEARLRMMTGSKIVSGQMSVLITVPKPAEGYCKAVLIYYDWGKDLYDVIGYSVHSKVLQRHRGIFAENLTELFEKMTGYLVRV